MNYDDEFRVEPIITEITGRHHFYNKTDLKNFMCRFRIETLLSLSFIQKNSFTSF